MSKLLIDKIKKALTRELLSPKYRKTPQATPLEGHCYVASEALYHLLGGAQAGLKAFVAGYIENGEKYTHWWLTDQNGKILDVTADQYLLVGKKPPYHLGRPIGFLTKNPSKRAQIVMQRTCAS